MPRLLVLTRRCASAAAVTATLQSGTSKIRLLFASSKDTLMELVVLTSLQMVPNFGQVVSITQYDLGISARAVSFSSMTLTLKSSVLATAPQVTG